MKSLTGLLLALLLPLSVSAAQLKLGAPFFPPYAYFDLDGNLSGIWIKKLTPVLQEAGIEYKAVNTRITRFYSSIATGKVELAALPPDMPGMENVIYSKVPFSQFDLRVFWTGDKPDISNLAQLSGQKVALIKGYNYGGALQNNLSEEARSNFVIRDNQLDAIKLLLSGETDYVLGYWAMMDYLQKNFPDTQLNNHKVAEIPIYLVMHNSADDAQAKIDKFDQALADLR